MACKNTTMKCTRLTSFHGIALAVTLLSSISSSDAFSLPSHSTKVTGASRTKGSSTALSFHNTFKNENDIFGISSEKQNFLPRATRKSKFAPSKSFSTALFFFGMNGGNDKDQDGRDNANAKGTKIKKEDAEIETKTNYDVFISDYFKPTLSFLKIAFPSFLVGSIATLSFIFLPIAMDYYDAYTSMKSDAIYSTSSGNGNNGKGGNTNNINQPVILFETILNDLNEAYVDDVDIQKLFETGVKAMTASLDPYTEFESRTEAQQLEETVSGRYGGVGLVIRGGVNLADASVDVGLVNENNPATSPDGGASKDSVPIQQNRNTPLDTYTPPVAVKDGGASNKLKNVDKSMNKDKMGVDEEEDEDETERKRSRRKSMEDGVRVVSAFEGYAYDAGFRVGDKLIAVDDFPITPTTSVDEVRNHLRGDPGTDVSITFVREGVKGVNGNYEPQTITMKRTIVQIPDVKYFGFVGDPKDGIGYIDLSGFASNAGREVRFAIRALQHGAEAAAMSEDERAGASMANIADPTKLKGLILDLRSNPGGLLTSAVDVATLFVPNGSDIVSAKGRGFPEMLYRSKTEPILNPNTRLAVLVNEQTASASEIVTGAVQDLDVGVVVGKGRTYGKGLVQNVQDLPYQTALKYTVAKYYTPSGRCIQSTVYQEGGRGDDLVAVDNENGRSKYKATKVADKDRNVFYTAHGRQVRDGGGIEVDYKVEPQKASPLEIILLNSGAYSEFSAEWSKSHELTDGFKVDDATYKEFMKFVDEKQKSGDLKLEVLYDSQLKELSKKLKATGLDSSKRELDKLRDDIIKDVRKDFIAYKNEIIEDVEQNILSRYLPESMLIERGLRSDVQVENTAKFLKDGMEFDKILARDKSRSDQNNAQKIAMGESDATTNEKAVPKLQTRW
mmetsp:Transcript_21377/g.43493  ORF Transcript_21377/g.43493 Transcript_21377/m.43493 type:complete len:901 (+) Transcript_21377:312-3014(+)